MRPLTDNSESEAKKEAAFIDFDLLLSKGTVAQYEECEFTHIFLIENSTRKVYHYFGIITFEEYVEVSDELHDKKITHKLISINSDLKLGIQQMRISLAEAREIFEQVNANALTFRKTPFIIPENLQLIPKVHVPGTWGGTNTPIDNVLKPNTWGDRYIIEFLSSKNVLNTLLSSTEFDKINTEIRNLIPIELAKVYDRIGSLIFEFPITLLSVSYGLMKNHCSLNLKIIPEKNLVQQDSICTTIKTSIDHTETGFRFHEGCAEEIELTIGDSNNMEIMIFNKNNGVIYHSSKVNFLRSIHMNFGIGTQNSEPRIFENSNGQKVEVSLMSYMSSDTGTSESYDVRINDRIRQNKILQKSGDFLNVSHGERIKALAYLRRIIQNSSTTALEIWLWDPYLKHTDIFDTIYYCTCPTVFFKCLTSKKTFQSDKENLTDHDSTNIDKFITSERQSFHSANTNNLGMNMEFRIAHGDSSSSFHDRFLLIIPKEKETLPIVYSLGTSVNSLGKAHHLIQKALDPKVIVNTFQKAWELANNPNTLIIKLPEVK